MPAMYAPVQTPDLTRQSHASSSLPLIRLMKLMYASGKTSSGLTYGLLPPRVMAMLGEKTNWKTRSEGVEELLIAIQKIDNSQQVAKHVPQIVDLLMSLVDDSNLQISLRALEVRI